MYKRKNIVQYVPIALVFILVTASFIDYIFNFCFTLFREGHVAQGIIYIIIYIISMIFFLSCYIMVTFSDPGSPTKDVVNVLSGNELASYYTTLEEIPEYKKMLESSSSDTSHQSTGALLRNEQNKNVSSSTLINNKQDREYNNIQLNDIPSTSNDTLTKPTENNPLLQNETVINMDKLINDSQDLGNTVFNRNTKKDQISIDIDNDKILERNIKKLNGDNTDDSDERINEEYKHNRRSAGVEDEEVNNLVCKKCLGFKPERTHHCSVCDRCVLKMDHHCPWISNCVGFYNYKYFMLFLFYGSIYILFQFFTILFTFVFTVKFTADLVENLIIIPNNKKLWVIHIFMSFVLGTAIFILFVSYIVQNLLQNSTTLELFDQQRKIRRYRFNIMRERRRKEIEKLENEVKELEEDINNSESSSNVNIDAKRKEHSKKVSLLKKRVKEYNYPSNRSPTFVSASTRNVPKSILHNPYDLGKLENFYQVFGKDPKLWFIPVPSSLGDGYHYPKYEYQA